MANENVTYLKRKKIGLSVSTGSVEDLNKLVELTGKSKGVIFEQAIKLMLDREELIQEGMRQVEKLGRDAFLNVRELKGKVAH